MKICNQKILCINVPITSIKTLPSIFSETETQCLFGERVKIINEENDWFFCETLLDNYQGWIEKKLLTDFFDTNYRVNKINTLVFEKPDLKSKVKFNLFLNSEVKVLDNSNNWSELKLSDSKGYIFSHHLIKKNKFLNDLILLSENFLNTPYLWGGKSCLGIDCSGFIQLLLQSLGKFIPRNTSDQILVENKFLKNTDIREEISLIFWNKHVALLITKDTIIHSNAYHMCVQKENVDQAIKRFEKQNNKILKIKKIIL